MYEPYGYDDAANYVSKKNQLDNELAKNRKNDCKEFASVEYNKSKQAFVFKNVNGQERGYAYMSEIIPQELIQDAYYDSETKNLVIVFENGKIVNIPLDDLIDVAEAGDGLKLEDNKFSINIANDSENFLSVDENGLKLDGVQDEIDAISEKASSAETELLSKIVEEKDRAVEKENEISNDLESETQARESGDTNLDLKIDNLEENVNTAIALKADADVVYTKADVDAMLSEKEAEIYSLKKIVGDIGGNVTFELPGEGKTFNTLMSNNGTVKLTDDVETGRFGPGITASNNVKLNLNTHDLTVTGLTTSTAYGAIQARGTQEITIYGKGTIDGGQGIVIQANGADCVINLTGSTTVYQTDRPNGELVYCYSGTINIKNGTFKNNGSTYLLNCYDANYRNGTAKIIVSGGKFYDFNPADNSAEGEHTNFLAEGYHVEESTDGESTVYTVKKDS